MARLKSGKDCMVRVGLIGATHVLDEMKDRETGGGMEMYHLQALIKLARGWAVSLDHANEESDHRCGNLCVGRKLSENSFSFWGVTLSL